VVAERTPEDSLPLGGTVKSAAIGAVSICIGSLLLLLRRPFGRFIVEQQNRAWGFKFGEHAVFSAATVSAIVGTGFVVVGLLAVIGLIKFR
jgi:NADH:ubiquinone oxidoreductase subunit 5 (subunit L)/multisubunit Na+/H+ antiporter MnhA subunit